MASCNAGPAEVTDPVECGVALTIESYNAKTYGSPKFAEDLAPILKWYTIKAATLPAKSRSKGRALSLMDEYRADSRLRKTVAKARARAALMNPAYQEVLPQLN